MKHARALAVAMALIGPTGLPVHAESEMVLDQVLKAGTTAHYDHEQSILLQTGFWAQAGSDVTLTVNRTPGFFIDKTPLDPKDGRYTSNAGRTFRVAGCVPKNYPWDGSPAGSSWLACNDLDYVKDKVVESAFISCLDLFPNGVLDGLFIEEVNNRTWQSFRFSCRDLQADGTLAAPHAKAPLLFKFEREGDLYHTAVPGNRLSLGITEFSNKLQFRRQSLLTIALDYGSAEAIFESGKSNAYPAGLQITDRIPPSSPQLGEVQHWFCPPGMVVTGAAMGHIPDSKGKDTRPVYILAECRKLLKNS